MSEAVVIGAGVIGCAVGLEIERAGGHAIVVDMNGEAGHGSTSASCGIVRRFYSTKTMTAMAHEGALVWADWANHLGASPDELLARFERPGMLFIPPAIDDTVRGIAAHMKEVGVPVDVLTADEVRARFPFFDTSSHAPVRDPKDDDFLDETARTIAGGVYEPDAGYVVSPQLAACNLRDAGVRAGVEFRLGRRVVAIRRDDGPKRFRLVLEGGPSREFVDTDVLVNVAGPHSSAIHRLAGVEVQIETRALRRETHAIENPAFSEADGSAVPVCGDVDSGIYFRPEAGGRDIIVGSLDPKCDVLEWVDDPDSFEPVTTGDAFERQVMRLMKRIPDVGLGKRRGVAGMYDVTPLDWQPVLDRADEPGYYMAIGTSGSSFKTAPIIGQAMACLIDACEGGRDHDADPVPFRLPRLDLEISLGFYSRLRGAQASSGTVLG